MFVPGSAHPIDVDQERCLPLMIPPHWRGMQRFWLPGSQDPSQEKTHEPEYR
jgi:hypothetical protein